MHALRFIRQLELFALRPPNDRIFQRLPAGYPFFYFHIRSASSSPKRKAAVTPANYIPPKSALLILGEAAQFAGFVTDPYVNFDAIFNRWQDFQAELTSRRFPQPSADLADRWKAVKSLKEERDQLHAARPKRPADGGIMSEAMIQEGRRLRQLLNIVDQKLVAIEVDTILEILKLPTDLHIDTPRSDQPRIVFSSPKETPASSVLPSWERFVTFSDVAPRGYYLRGKLAELELALIFYTKNYLVIRGFDPVSGPHLFKSVLLEGCGVNLSINQGPAYTVKCEDSFDSLFRSLFLTDSALHNFAGYLTNCLVDEKVLPVKLMSSGRIYRNHGAIAGGDLSARLFYPDQTHCVSFCSGYQGMDETQRQLDVLIGIMKDFYSHLGVPFRMTMVPASQLKVSEACRYQAEMWSPSRMEWIPCGYVAGSDEFVSRRLRFHVGRPEELNFLSLIHGSLLDLTPFLAVCLETLTGDPDTWFEGIVPTL